MARRLTELIEATTPLDKSEILIVHQADVDRRATIQDLLDVGYLSSTFDSDFSAKTTDNLTEGTNKYFFNHNNTYHTETFLVAADITYELLDSNGDIGVAGDQLAIGNHNHAGIYEPAFVKNTGFNKNLGTASGTVSEGDHAHSAIYLIESELDDRYVNSSSDTMTGTLAVGSTFTAPTINISSVNPADTATMFGTDSSGDSIFHFRIGNGSEDKILFESWNGAAATSLLEIGQTDVTILGDLNVSGTTTTVDSTTVDIADNEITLNSNVTGTPSLSASLIIERGTSTDAAIRWNESTTIWDLTPGTGTYSEIMTVATSDDRYLNESSNLSDLDDAATARTNLGLGSSATINAVSTNTASNVVLRDVSGNFSAGTITAALTGTASNAALLDSMDSATAATASTIVARDASIDITTRLFRSTYAEQTSAPAATADIAFRINNTTDNYIRFMSKSAAKSYLGINRGAGTFNNTPNVAVTISHTLATATFSVSITPTAVTGGFVGEWYVRNKTTTTFDVFKTGSATGITFDWIAIDG